MNWSCGLTKILGHRFCNQLKELSGAIASVEDRGGVCVVSCLNMCWRCVTLVKFVGLQDKNWADHACCKQDQFSPVCVAKKTRLRTVSKYQSVGGVSGDFWWRFVAKFCKKKERYKKVDIPCGQIDANTRAKRRKGNSVV